MFEKVPFPFYRKSIAAASTILLCRHTGDTAKEAEAVAISHRLWCEHKMAPQGLPPPVLKPTKLDALGLTVLWPFADESLMAGCPPPAAPMTGQPAAAPCPRPALRT